MINPLFKTHASIGRSILRLDDVDRICTDNNIDEVYLVEDSMTSFPEAFRLFGDRLRFGLRFSIFNDQDSPESESKVIGFADGDEGCRDLYKLFTESFDKKLTTPWDDYENIHFSIPFYDSFLHKNITTFGNCMPNLPRQVWFHMEDNGLPFDGILRSKVKEFIKNHPNPSCEVKSIYYENKEDVEAFQTYKAICNRQPGRQANLSNPRLDHFGSDRFCVEAWKEGK